MKTLLWSVTVALALCGAAADRDEICVKVNPEEFDCAYTVEKGDFMYKIAQQHGVRPQRLLEANPQINNPNLIRPGDEINVPCSDNVLDLLCSTKRLSLFLEAVHAVGLTELFADASVNATVFAPSNHALLNLTGGLGLTWANLLKDVELLDEVVSYHVVPNVALSHRSLAKDLLLTTMGGQQLQVDRRSATRKFLRTATGQRVRVLKAPLEAGGSAVYIINEVLMPAESFAPPCAYTVKPGDTLWAIAEKFDKELETVIAANPDIDPHAIMPGQQINIPCS